MLKSKNTYKKSTPYLKKTQFNQHQEQKRISQGKTSQKYGKQFSYLNKKMITQSNDIRFSQNKSSLRKLYILPKSNLQKTQKIPRKSYSRQFQQSRFLHEKSFDYANRFTLADFTLNQNKIEQTILKKNIRKPTNKTTLKKTKSPYDKIQKVQKIQNIPKPIDIKDNHKINKKNYTQNNQIIDSHQKKLQIIQQIGEGTFGKVYKAKLLLTGQIVAVKRVLQDKKYKSRQLQIIKILKSNYIMKTYSTFITYQNNKDNQNIQQYLNIVMDYYQCNLYQYYSKNKGLTNTLKLKIILYQMFRGLLYIHSLGICHRDIKPHNMLIKNGRLSLCDFGSAKILKKDQVNLSYICSRCYRAPQLIFGCVYYTTQIDIWSAGCIILEIINRVPLFIGQSSLDHLVQVIKIMGTPSKSDVMAMNPEYDLRQYDFPQINKKQWSKLFPTVDPLLLNLVDKIMCYSPHLRLTASQALAHQYFDQLRKRQSQGQIRKIVNNQDFFQFNNNQLKLISNSSNLIPNWYHSS